MAGAQEDSMTGTSGRNDHSPAQPEHSADLLHAAGLEDTQARRRILAALHAPHGTTPVAVSAQDLLAVLRKDGPFDKVTLYRTLDLFTEHGIIQRHSAGDRSFRYCMAGLLQTLSQPFSQTGDQFPGRNGDQFPGQNGDQAAHQTTCGTTRQTIHGHFYCTRCGTMACLEMPQPDMLRLLAPSAGPYAQDATSPAACCGTTLTQTPLHADAGTVPLPSAPPQRDPAAQSPAPLSVLPGRVEAVEIRLDGICARCLGAPR